MKLLQLSEDGSIAKCPQNLLNFVQNLAILLSKTTGFCLMSNRVVEDILLIALRILSVTLVAIDIAILKIFKQTWTLCVFVAKVLPIESQNRKTARRFMYIHSFEQSFRFFDFVITESHFFITQPQQRKN